MSCVGQHLNPNQYFLTGGGCSGSNSHKSFITTQSGEIKIALGLHANRQEADTLIWYHVIKSPLRNVLVVSPDTDVYMIGLPIVESDIDQKFILVQLSMVGDSFLNINDLISSLHRDPELAYIPKAQRSKCLQILYMVSGCDYLLFWVDHGKVHFLNTLILYVRYIILVICHIPQYRIKTLGCYHFTA